LQFLLTYRNGIAPENPQSLAEPGHWSECGRATSLADSTVAGRPHRSVFSFGFRASAMTRTFWIQDVWRWFLVPCASAVAYFAALYFSLFILILGPFPPPLAAPTAGILMGFIVVLAGSLVAPRHRVVTAIVLYLTGCLTATLMLKFHAVSTSAGGLAAVALVAWWFHPRRTERSILWVGIGLSVAFLTFIGLVYAHHVDRLASPEPLPSELSHALGTNALRVTAFYRYDLGGFIDHDWLWRIDASPEVVGKVVSGLGLRSTNAVPTGFFQMPPHYWPRSMPEGGESFQSSAFSATSRGPDGAHYFLLHDKTQGRVFVWFKAYYF
jgi:hypothetical protein